MEELTGFQLLANRLLYLIGWIIGHIRYIFTLGNNANNYISINSPLLWLTFGLFFAFAALHIFKRILGKG